MHGVDIDPSLVDRARKNLEFFHALHCKPDDSAARDEEQQLFPISFPMCLGPLPILDHTSFPGNVSFSVENVVAAQECDPETYDVVFW